MNMTLEEVKEKIVPVLQKSGVEYAGAFGSVARGEAKPDSDVDILVKFKVQPTFASYLQLDDRLKQALNLDIDLVTVGGVNKFLRPYIERDLKLIYGQR